VKTTFSPTEGKKAAGADTEILDSVSELLAAPRG
jgi:hypothetical protein